jgi:hypothetical protein
MDEDLRQSLNALKAELDRLDSADPDKRATLERLIDDIEHKLQHPDQGETSGSLIERAKESIEHFEVSHPRATAILNDIMMTLSNMGI